MTNGITKLTGKIVTKIFSSMMKQTVDSSSSLMFSGIRHVPQGLKNKPVWLWSPTLKDYGLWSMARAERICRQHSGWQWTIKHKKPSPPILSLIPIIVAAGVVMYILKESFKITVPKESN